MQTGVTEIPDDVMELPVTRNFAEFSALTCLIYVVHDRFELQRHSVTNMATGSKRKLGHVKETDACYALVIDFLRH